MSPTTWAAGPKTEPQTELTSAQRERPHDTGTRNHYLLGVPGAPRCQSKGANTGAARWVGLKSFNRSRWTRQTGQKTPARYITWVLLNSGRTATSATKNHPYWLLRPLVVTHSGPWRGPPMRDSLLLPCPPNRWGGQPPPSEIGSFPERNGDRRSGRQSPFEHGGRSASTQIYG